MTFESFLLQAQSFLSQPNLVWISPLASFAGVCLMLAGGAAQERWVIGNLSLAVGFAVAFGAFFVGLASVKVCFIPDLDMGGAAVITVAYVAAVCAVSSGATRLFRASGHGPSSPANPR